MGVSSLGDMGFLVPHVVMGGVWILCTEEAPAGNEKIMMCSAVTRGHRLRPRPSHSPHCKGTAQRPLPRTS